MTGARGQRRIGWINETPAFASRNSLAPMSSVGPKMTRRRRNWVRQMAEPETDNPEHDDDDAQASDLTNGWKERKRR